MPRKSPDLPRVNRVHFYRLSEGELVALLAGAIEGRADQASASLSADHEAIVTWSRLERDVLNGGFEQYFFNRRGDQGIAPLVRLLTKLGLPKDSTILQDASAVYRTHRSKFEVENPWDGLFGSIAEFSKLDRAFAGSVLRGNRTLEPWIRDHIAELAVGDDGEVIDPRLTGSVETHQPNGLVAEHLEVKNGKPSGAYREFFDDGTVRHAVFYKAGKVSADFWPSGQLKRKEFKRGTLKVIEWYHPGGQLWKRYVAGKDGYAAEPIRLYHENGQLAEELTTVRDNKKGPWRKFFDDGSPRLEARYLAGEKLVVDNAWDDDRTQVVKNGAGVFRDDGKSIDWEYNVFFEYHWTTESELKNGVPDGKETTYHKGVLNSVRRMKNGVWQESTSYWDNGRVRSIAKSRNGKERTQWFPKFDHPVAVVLLTVEANEGLYTAWNHIRVDEYPKALNLKKLQQTLRSPKWMPAFLREVEERNRAGAIQTEYEDWTTFNDGIAYFLKVDESGAVASVATSGSGPCSGGAWDTYPPLLRELKFRPGRVRGRAVPCDVVAWVRHTFEEGKTGNTSRRRR